MNRFELFSMIYYALENEWEESKNQDLADFLSSANPFLFKDLSSANPLIFNEFCKQVIDPITIENSYVQAMRYIKSLNMPIILEAFNNIDENQWFEGLKDYLSHNHKGM